MVSQKLHRLMYVVPALALAVAAAAQTTDTTPPRAVVAMRMDNGVLCTTSLRVCWTGIDDTTATEKLVYSWKLDDGNWSSYSAGTHTEMTGLAEGDHTFSVKARDEAGNEEQDPKTQRFSVSLSAPKIDRISVEPAADQASVSWTTDKSCYSRIEFGPTKDYGSVVQETPGSFSDHKMVLGGLSPETTYHFRIRSKSLCEIETISPDQTLTTAKAAETAVPATTPIPATTPADATSAAASDPACAYVRDWSRRPAFTHTGRPSSSKALCSYGYTVTFSPPPPLSIRTGEERDIVPNGDRKTCPDKNITEIVPKVDYSWTVYSPSGAIAKQGTGLTGASVLTVTPGDYRCVYTANWTMDAQVLSPTSGTIDMGAVSSCCGNWDLRVEIVSPKPDALGRISLAMDPATGEPLMPGIRARVVTRSGRVLKTETVKWSAKVVYQTDQHGNKSAPWRELILDSKQIESRGEVGLEPHDWPSVGCGTLTLVAEYIDPKGYSHKGVSAPVEITPCTKDLPWGNPEPWMIAKALKDILAEIGDPDLTACEKALYSIGYLESGFRQFWEYQPGRPCWSGDKLGGVGIMQLTYPEPTLEQTWNWKADIRAGVALFRVKIEVARSYVKSVQDAFNDPNGDYHKALDKYNEVNHPLSVPVTIVQVQPPTQEQIVRDAVRLYNGAPGRDPVGRRNLHEFQIRFTGGVLALENVHEETRDGQQVGVATAVWEDVTQEMRAANYAANGIGASVRYVANVLGLRIKPGDPLPIR